MTPMVPTRTLVAATPVVAAVAALVPRDTEFPFPSEEEARALMLPTKASKAVFTLSCMIVQVIFDSLMCGIFTVQLYTYCRFQSRDRWWTRALVGIVAVLSYAMSAYIIWFIQHFFIENFGKYQTFFETPYLAWFPLVDSIISGFTQSFFTYRAWRLNHRNWVLLIVLVLLIITAFAASLWTKIRFTQFDSLLAAPRVRILLTPAMSLWLAAIMAADIIITIAILRGLLRTRTGWTRTDRVISRLVRMTFESQVPPTILATIFLIQYSILPASLLGSTFQAIQSKLYSIGLLYTLNARVLYTPADITIGNTGGDDDMRGMTARTVEMTPAGDKAVWEYEMRRLPGESGRETSDDDMRRDDAGGDKHDASSAEKADSARKSDAAPAEGGSDRSIEDNVPVLLK